MACLRSGHEADWKEKACLRLAGVRLTGTGWHVSWLPGCVNVHASLPDCDDCTDMSDAWNVLAA